MRALPAFALLAALAAGAQAQTTETVAQVGGGVARAAADTVLAPFSNLRLRGGVFFPTYNRAGVSTDAGLAYGVGYTFSRKALYELEAEYFGTYNKIKSNFGGVSYEDDVTMSVISVLARVRPLNGPLYGAAGFGLGQGNARNTKDGITGVMTLLGGFQATQNVFFELRYQKGFESYLDGIAVTVGYRF